MPEYSGYRVGKATGGAECEAFERELEAYYSVPYARVFNSATSALHAACVATGKAPVAVTPLSMSASVSCVLHANRSPIFHDIRDDYSYASTPNEGTAVLPHLFGHHVARPNVRHVIHDCAQSPSVMPVANEDDIWVYSLNQHKVITCGEGGYALTYSKDVADILHAVRNHGECFTEDVLGWNYRMTELEAVVAREQFRELDDRLEVRRVWADCLRKEHDLAEDVGNVDFFLYAFKCSNAIRHQVVSEIPGARAGYHTPIYKLPYFAKRYAGVVCPNAEKIESELVIVNPEAYGI